MIPDSLKPRMPTDNDRKVTQMPDNTVATNVLVSTPVVPSVVFVPEFQKLEPATQDGFSWTPNIPTLISYFKTLVSRLEDELKQIETAIENLTGSAPPANTTNSLTKIQSIHYVDDLNSVLADLSALTLRVTLARRTLSDATSPKA